MSRKQGKQEGDKILFMLHTFASCLFLNFPSFFGTDCNDPERPKPETEIAPKLPWNKKCTGTSLLHYTVAKIPRFAVLQNPSHLILSYQDCSLAGNPHNETVS